MAERTSSGVGCSRNSRTRPVAWSRSSRLGVYAGAASPMARPATTGSTPLDSSATQMTTPRTKNTRDLTRRCSVRATSSTPNTATAIAERHEFDALAVDQRDHDQGGQIVHDEHGEHEHPDPVGHIAPEQRQQTQRERGVGGHGHAPAVRARPAGIDGQVDEHGDGHAGHTGSERQDEPAAITQVAEVELAPGLQAHDEEEQRHQPAVDPRLQIMGEARPGRAGSTSVVCHTCVVGVQVDVGPDQRDGDSGDEHARAARLGAQELAQRRRPARAATRCARARMVSADSASVMPESKSPRRYRRTRRHVDPCRLERVGAAGRT